MCRKTILIISYHQINSLISQGNQYLCEEWEDSIYHKHRHMGTRLRCPGKERLGTILEILHPSRGVLALGWTGLGSTVCWYSLVWVLASVFSKRRFQWRKCIVLQRKWGSQGPSLGMSWKNTPKEGGQLLLPLVILQEERLQKTGPQRVMVINCTISPSLNGCVSTLIWRASNDGNNDSTGFVFRFETSWCLSVPVSHQKNF